MKSAKVLDTSEILAREEEKQLEADGEVTVECRSLQVFKENEAD